MVSLWNSLCVIMVGVEAVGGGCLEKTLHVKLILGKPFQAVTQSVHKPVNHAQCTLQFLYDKVF